MSEHRPHPAPLVAVTTPTGNVGTHLVAALLRAGVRPRVLVRDPARLTADVREHVDVAVADLHDAGAVVAATEGVDALYWVDPTSGGEDPLADHARATTAVVEAVRVNRIGRVVFQSSVGAEKRHGAGEIDGLAATELALDDLAGQGLVDVVHLRCGFFFTNLLLQLEEIRAGVVHVVLPIDQPMPWVAPRDVAEVAAGRLLSTAWTGRVVQAVHGPTHLGWAQAVDVVTAATDTPVRVERVDDDAMRASLRAAGMTTGLVDAVLGMSTGLRDGFTPEQARTTASTTPTTLGAWAYEHLRPLV